MTAGTGGLLAGMGPLDEHVSRLPTTTPINTNPVSPVFRPTRPIEALGGTLGGMTWMALLAPKGTTHPTQCTAMYPATDFGPPSALSVLTGPIG